jgi:sodium transport system permease protein
MSAIYHIIKKELTETLRDKRTLMTMIVIPILLFPVLLSLIVRTQQHFSEEANNKTITIAYEESFENNEVVLKIKEIIDKDPLFNLQAVRDSNGITALIQQDSIQAMLLLGETKIITPVTVWHDGTKINIIGRIQEKVEAAKQMMISEQMQAQNIDPKSISGFEYQMMSTASTQETIGKLAGGLLPYIFIVFGFLGCMYPAIDLFTGEKERGTIETLLTAPIARWKILLGKMSVVVISGLLAASLSLLGLYISIRGLNLIEDPALLSIINSILSVKFVAVLFLLQIPLTIFFAGILVPIAIHAKSFKEAQSIITPLNFVVILPAMIGFLPQIELNPTTAMIPIVNIVLATKDLIAGTLNYFHLLLSALMMCLIALTAVFFSYKQFEKESNVLN